MSDNNFAVVGQVNTPIKLLALTLVVVEAALAGLIFALPNDHRLMAFGIFGGLISLTIITLLAIERLRTTALAIASPKISVREIPSRRDMYLECAKLISTANTVFDTTWGIDPRPRSPQEEKAREEYRKSLDAALKSGKIYRELFDISAESDNYTQKARETIKKYPCYDARMVAGNSGSHSILEFLVADNDKVILSHVDAKHEIPKYLYVESQELADMYIRLHREHWANAQKLEATS